MKIHFLGLSCFLIENDEGYRIVVDPYNDAPEWALGPKFPKTFKGKAFGANLVLMSEPDADHAYAPGGWLQTAPQTGVNSDPFPKLDLKGTVIYEWNGDLNIAWNYTIDGVRLAHFGDNAHKLTKKQLKEIGKVDIIFMSAPKVKNDTSLDHVRQNIQALRPKLVVWAHHIVPDKMPGFDDGKKFRAFFVRYFKRYASTGPGYEDSTSFMELATLLQNANALNKEYSGKTLKRTSITINKKTLPRKTTGLLFLRMLGKE
ncbi:hypothetical protein HOI83_03525 [Candidatus Uhrbacteria bacterium]|jgi:L-ascorbate metabolism protein UlaG (beta-lactamase superfamily)|nr:hypothetical protein [Candidatus Uhrbacteria bacterium]